MNWKFLYFEELNTSHLYQLLQLRSEVFVVEQNCVYQDIDGMDQKGIHLLGYLENELVAYARIFEKGIYFEEASIGRVIVKANHRKKEIGHQLIKKSIQYVFDELKCSSIRISAQQYLTKFYAYHGFKEVGEGYLEDGIPHINMLME